MNFIKENIELLITVVTSIGAVWAFVDKRSRDFIFRKFENNKSKAQIKNDEVTATDSAIETMMARINTLGEEYVRLSEANSEVQRENYELKSQINTLEHEKVEYNRIILKCKNNCFDV